MTDEVSQVRARRNGGNAKHVKVTTPEQWAAAKDAAIRTVPKVDDRPLRRRGRMKTIYKYRLEPGVTLLTVRGEILSAGVQGDDIMVWAVHDDDRLERQARVSVMGTGHPFVDAPESDFIGTVFLGALVFHVFATIGMIGENLESA